MENEELRRRNHSLATQLEKHRQLADDLLFRISQLEEKQSEDDTMLCGINRLWKILDENCGLFVAQFDACENTGDELFGKLENNAESFLIQYSTWDIDELKEKLDKRAQLSKQNVEKVLLALYKILIRTNKLHKLMKNKVLLQPEEIKRLQQSIKFRRKILTLHRNYYILNSRIRNKQDILSIRETKNDELKNRVDNLRYQNTKMKAVGDRMEHNLAELLDEIKSVESIKNDKESETVAQTASPPDSNNKNAQLEQEIENQRKISEKYLHELQALNLKEQEAVKRVETLKIDVRQLPEKIIVQSEKYKYLQSKFSILYNEATQLRLNWEEVQKQMHLLKSSFNSAQEASERECLNQQKTIRQEMIKLDDTNGQLRKECQQLKMELEQSLAENNLFGSLNSEMKKLMSSMLDYCKQHESDIKRYKRKYEEVEEDIRFSKAVSPVTVKCDKLVQFVRYRKFQKRRKEKDCSNKDHKINEQAPPPIKNNNSRYKDISTDLTNGKGSFLDSADLINPKEMQHIKNIILNANETDKLSATMRRELSPYEETKFYAKDPLHVRDSSLYDDLLKPKEALRIRYRRNSLERDDKKYTKQPYGKLMYSKEVLRSKEMLKERYLRDCTRMKMKKTSFKLSQSPLLLDAVDSDKSYAKNTKLNEYVDDTKTSNSLSKTATADKITSFVNLDSDDSGHDEPKSHRSDEYKSIASIKDKSTEENNFETIAAANDIQTEEKMIDSKQDSKEQSEIKKTPPSKRDILVRKLKYKLKVIVDEKKDLNLLLGMYKNMNKTDEERVQLMVSEQKLKSELNEVKKQMRRIEESRYDDRKDLVDVVTARKIRYLLAKRRRLQKKIEEAKDSLLCGEMEITGQVWDELQAQNTRLHQLLREKDEENLKLMTERVKSNQLYNLSKEENESVMQHINANNEKIETKSEIIQKLEERELAYRNRLAFYEQELTSRKKACESSKRKVLENAQSIANFRRQIEKYQRLSKEIQQIKTDKSSQLEAKTHKNNILSEEVTQFKKKVERMKRCESIDTIEAILAEELREYKNILTCPSCKVNKKDAVLIKCFHVYCLNCIKTRYETRQRKCPECCAPFGANDYHRLFLFN